MLDRSSPSLLADTVLEPSKKAPLQRSPWLAVAGNDAADIHHKT